MRIANISNLFSYVINDFRENNPQKNISSRTKTKKLQIWKKVKNVTSDKKSNKMIGEYYQRKNTHLVDWQMCKTMHFQGNTNKKNRQTEVRHSAIHRSLSKNKP